MNIKVNNVAPCVGAWIEIPPNDNELSESIVAPCVGAWIEIQIRIWMISYIATSLPAWERGLKYAAYLPVLLSSTSLPVRERGLKLRK